MCLVMEDNLCWVQLNNEFRVVLRHMVEREISSINVQIIDDFTMEQKYQREISSAPCSESKVGVLVWCS